MAVPLPCLVLVWFGRPIEPYRTTYVRGPDVTDPPLDVDELPGWLEAWRWWPAGWRGLPGGWFGQVTYNYPSHGFGMTGRMIDWFPAKQLRPLPAGESLVGDGMGPRAGRLRPRTTREALSR
jgi:hypothetical protein